MEVSLKENNWFFVTDQTPRLEDGPFEVAKSVIFFSASSKPAHAKGHSDDQLPDDVFSKYDDFYYYDNDDDHHGVAKSRARRATRAEECTKCQTRGLDRVDIEPVPI
jgi:hypothetical protein